MKSVIGFPDNRLPPRGSAALSTGILPCGGWKTYQQWVCFGPTIQGLLHSASSRRLLFQQWKTEGGKRWTQSAQHTNAKTHIADISATSICRLSQVGALQVWKLTVQQTPAFSRPWQSSHIILAKQLVVGKIEIFNKLLQRRLNIVSPSLMNSLPTAKLSQEVAQS